MGGRSDVKPSGEDQALVTLDNWTSLKNNNGPASSGLDSPDNASSGLDSPNNASSGLDSPDNANSGLDSPDSKKYIRPLLASKLINTSSTSGHLLGQNKHPVMMRPFC